MIPDGALFHWKASENVAVYDVGFLLPQHRIKRYRTRAPATEVYVHHSGRLGRPGFDGLYNSARYVVQHRDWPGCPYHYWIPYEPDVDDDGSLVVYQAQDELTRTYHAGPGPNDRALAICLQGNSSRHEPTEEQLECLGAFLADWHPDQVHGHCEAPLDGHAKASCPGSHAMAFVRGVRAA